MARRQGLPERDARYLTAVGAIGALTVLNARAHSAELDPITISAPTVKMIGRAWLTEAPIEEDTVKAQIAVDMETLRNDSGVVLLKDRCSRPRTTSVMQPDPLTEDDGTCVREAVKSVKPQVDAAIARARSNTVM